MKRGILKILYQPYKWLFFMPLLAVNTLFFGISAVILSTIINQKTGSYFGGAIWSRFNAFFTPMFVKVYGKNNIKKGASYIVVSNHRSYYDVFAIYGWLGIDLKFVMKKELEKIPGIGFGSKKVGHIFIDRSNKRVAIESLKSAKEKLKYGSSVIIFPEGTRSKDGKIGTFKRGGFKMAFDLGLPILPVTVLGTEKILPADTIDLMPGCAKVIIHEPIDILLYKEESMSELIDLVKVKIKEGIDRFESQ